MRKFLYKSSYIFIISFIILNLIAVWFDFVYMRSSIFKPLLFKNNNADAIVLGSSRALTGINTNILQNKINGNFNWFNYSIDDTHIETHLLELKLLLKSNRKPSLILLQYDRINAKDKDHQILERDYQFLPLSIDGNVDLWNYFKVKDYNFGGALYLLPVLKYIYYNTELTIPLLKRLFFGDFRYKSDKNGDYRYPVNKIDTIPCNVNYYDSLFVEDSHFTEFVDLCSQNSVKLIVYIAPIKCDEILSKSNVKGVSILNFSNFFKGKNWVFADGIHINSLGVDSFSYGLCKKVNYILNE